jgi:hypothetical protein
VYALHPSLTTLSSSLYFLPITIYHIWRKKEREKLYLVPGMTIKMGFPLGLKSEKY